MRIRVAVTTVVSGAVVLSALAVPVAAQAAERTSASTRLSFFASDGSRTVRPNDSLGNTKFSNAVVNGGKDIVLGTTGTKSVVVTYTATDQNGIALTEAFLWQGTDSSTTDGITGGLGTDDDPSCTETATQGVYKCKAVFNIHPATDMKDNGVAGTWKLFLGAWDLYANASYNDDVTTAAIKKAATLTADATPEPVKKGRTLTVTGKLARANWSTGKYAGYVSQPVKLQFRKKGSSTYTTLKTVKTNSTGVLKTTAKATVDGYYRYSFAGTATTAAATAPGDFVDVR
ncbi:hypothetical protein TUSST3_78930 [Streptomyces sp. TUS-ST3]|jgi:hypothetical protein|uniref:hypothetical protein n=1 Tax=Streptomyces sp. TUS-ST3 TaxID=3025591 RepID=UPI000F4DF75F|nr:hypothetical protein [Streptomyces sp. TUS-ST3]GLP71273.1 hypothetical protein TUSST3_78930 [Streptomyces sp. TUS-ST3]